jgi:phosphomannomutase
MIANDALPAPAPRRGSVVSRDILPEYVEKVMSFIDPGAIEPFSVVLDAGSGMAGLVAPKLFARLPCRLTTLCFTIDGTFPTHEANPLIEENRRDITAEVIRQKADIGIAWDGDADRCFFIDGTGEFISGDFVTALLAEAFLLKEPGATIVYDLRASHAVKDVVGRYGGRALENRVGHAFIKRRMRDEDAAFGGEVTGHYYFRDFYYADNGFIPAGKSSHCAICCSRFAIDISFPARSTRSWRRCSRCRRSSRPSRRATKMVASRRWTECRWNTPTGTSTCARRTPSRSCASTSSLR